MKLMKEIRKNEFRHVVGGGYPETARRIIKVIKSVLTGIPLFSR